MTSCAVRLLMGVCVLAWGVVELGLLRAPLGIPRKARRPRNAREYLNEAMMLMSGESLVVSSVSSLLSAQS